MESTEAKIHPIDVRPLNRGDVISEEVLRSITCEEPGTDPFKLSVLSIRSFIKKQLLILGRPWEVVCDGNTLRVLTNLEQSQYEHDRILKGERMILTGHAMAQSVDSAEFTESERRQHERRLEVQGWKVLGLAMAREKSLPNAASRGMAG